MKQEQYKTLQRALKAIPNPSDEELEDAENTAFKIVREVEKAYSAMIREGKHKAPTGLIYGKIQSGKTRAMVLSTALAIDMKYKIIIVLTTDNNRLVSQTKIDFEQGLPGIQVFSKDDLETEIEHIGNMLKRRKSVVIVSSKGAGALRKIAKLLRKISAQSYKCLIFDDEGDQATLDTNTLQRSRGETLLNPSTINSLIHHDTANSLRSILTRHVFVSVTGTPQGLILQNIGSSIKPSFIELMQPGRNYIGGETFFPESSPNSNLYIRLIASNEKLTLLNKDLMGIPEGLKQAICFFLLAASAASTQKGWPNGGYKSLYHPSVKQDDHRKVARGILAFVEKIANALTDPTNEKSIEELKILRNEYENLLRTAPKKILSFSKLTKVVLGHVDGRRIQILNGRTTNQTFSFSPFFNFLIGGNSIGRGLAIKNLLVTYYVREARRTQMDTMYQHARMFGYRKETLPFTRVFLPVQLYNRFHQIYKSDEELRSFIDNYGAKAKAILIRTSAGIGLRPTRKSIIDANNTMTLYPQTQLFPNYPIYKATSAKQIKERSLKKLNELFPDYKKGAKKLISTLDAIKLLSFIPTKATNNWNDKQIPFILRSYIEQMGDGVFVRYRKSPRRTPGESGLLQTVLSGDEVKNSAKENKPVLWISLVSGKNWDKEDFVYPTVVLPRDSTPFVFNRKT